MSERDSEHDDAMDGLLRRTLGSRPAPALPPGFDRRLARRLRRRALSTRGRHLLVAYAVVAVAVSAGVLGRAALPWPIVIGAVLISLAAVAAVVPGWRPVRRP